MLGGVERPQELRHLLEPLELAGLGQVPHGFRLEARLGQVELDGLERRLVADRLPLVRDHALGHRDAAEREVEAAAAFEPERLFDGGIRLLLRLRVVIAGVRRHGCSA